MRNFIHHNELQNAGYGVESINGAYPTIDGNTFVSNRHAVTSDGRAWSGYLAYFNLVLTDAPAQEAVGGLVTWMTQDFDVHGRDNTGWKPYSGSTAGNHIEILQNTFMGRDRQNLDLRGTPCDFAVFGGNMSQREEDGAVNYDGEDESLKLQLEPRNEFERPTPMRRFGVGDFDGDGFDDLFIACAEPEPERRRFVGIVKDAKSSQIGMETAAIWGMPAEWKRCLDYRRGPGKSEITI